MTTRLQIHISGKGDQWIADVCLMDEDWAKERRDSAGSPDGGACIELFDTPGAAMAFARVRGLKLIGG